jgi:hypothetical protein
MNILPSAHPSLNQWGPQSSIGKIVFEIIQRFHEEPPQFLPYPPSSGTNNPPPPSPPIKNSQPPPSPVLPSPPTSFPELEKKSVQELTQLLNDENEFKIFFESLGAVQNMKKLRDELKQTNEQLARNNLEKEAELESLRRELNPRLSAVADKRMQFEQKFKQQQDVLKQYSTAALIEQLSKAMEEAEHQSEEIAEHFLSGDMDQKDFVKDFQEKRRLYHLRAAKRESLQMLASQHHRP